jgi:orotate phosphoribosyltransferase
MEEYKQNFIKFLVQAEALKFGEFTLKSGRVAPFFINTGLFSDGEKIAKLGEYYAQAIKEHFGNDFDTVYGPAYKGIPLCTTTAIALSKLEINKGYSFNRKKLKDYGTKDNIVGQTIDKDSRLILVDDVITAGTSIRETIDFLKDYGSPKINGIIVSVNRMEKGTGEKSALKRVEEELNIPIYAIVNLKDVIEVLHNKEIEGKVHIDDEMLDKIQNYMKEYGAEGFE